MFQHSTSLNIAAPGSRCVWDKVQMDSEKKKKKDQNSDKKKPVKEKDAVLGRGGP